MSSPVAATGNPGKGPLTTLHAENVSLSSRHTATASSYPDTNTTP
jgi:hypothetical protein